MDRDEKKYYTQASIVREKRHCLFYIV